VQLSSEAPLTAPLERIKELADDLARLREGDPARQAIAERITEEANAVLRALARPKS
jgi:hypothetical protein